MTNYEKIKNMSVEQMGDFLANGDEYCQPCEVCPHKEDGSCIHYDCKDGVIKWLESKVKNYIKEEEWVEK